MTNLRIIQIGEKIKVRPVLFSGSAVCRESVRRHALTKYRTFVILNIWLLCYAGI